MARLTITLSDDRHRALKEAAARRGKTIGEIVAESLEFYGVKSTASARDLVRQARKRSRKTEAELVENAVEETRRQRGT